MRVRPGIEVVSLTDVGCQRENNEDNFVYWEPDDDADFAVQEKARQDARLRGMGTTLTAAAIVGSQLCFAHVGDSRLYLFRKGSLRALTRDHSLVARLVESGVIRAQEADSHPQRHVLTAAIGVTD